MKALALILECLGTLILAAIVVGLLTWPMISTQLFPLPDSDPPAPKPDPHEGIRWDQRIAPPPSTSPIAAPSTKPTSTTNP